jgi:hypothetical protein
MGKLQLAVTGYATSMAGRKQDKRTRQTVYYHRYHRVWITKGRYQAMISLTITLTGTARLRSLKTSAGSDSNQLQLEYADL